MDTHTAGSPEDRVIRVSVEHVGRPFGAPAGVGAWSFILDVMASDGGTGAIMGVVAGPDDQTNEDVARAILVDALGIDPSAGDFAATDEPNNAVWVRRV